MSSPPLTLIRLRTPVSDHTDVDTQMAIIARIPGTLVAYREGQYIISLHNDPIPSSNDNHRAKRVRAVMSPENQ